MELIGRILRKVKNVLEEVGKSKMPIPKPRENEEKDKFVSRCISTLVKIDPNRPKNQIIAMCYSSWNEDKKTKLEQDPEMNTVEWVKDDIGTFIKKVKQAKERTKMSKDEIKHVMLESWGVPIKIRDGLVHIIDVNGGNIIHIDYNRVIPERDLQMEAKLTDVLGHEDAKDEVVFNYTSITKLPDSATKVFDLYLIPARHEIQLKKADGNDDEVPTIGQSPEQSGSTGQISEKKQSKDSRLDKSIQESEDYLNTTLKVKKLKLLDKMLEE